jgi:zinc/manganese transport system ATP-binding protein
MDYPFKAKEMPDVLLERIAACASGFIGRRPVMAAELLGGVMNPAVTLHDLTLAYDRVPAVHHLNGAFASGEMSAIAGPNGAGKSTLLKAIAGILPIFEGSIEFSGVTRKEMAYLPQAADLQRDFPINVLQMVTSGFWQQAGGYRRITPAQREQAHGAMAAVGLSGFGKRTLDSLSAGQFQRTLFARLLVQDAKLILLDEPFNAIDAATTAALLEVIHHWHRERRTVICVLHDFEQIKEHFPHCLFMARECIAWGDSHEVLKPENLLNARIFREAAPQAKAGQR